MPFLYQMHIETLSLDIMYHEEQIQYISPTKLASKHVTTNKLIFNNNQSSISTLFFNYTYLHTIFISKTIKYMQDKKNVHLRSSLCQNRFLNSLYPIILLLL